jgi:hypothetical protein
MLQLGRAVAQANEDHAYNYGQNPKAYAYPLQGAKSAPLTSPGDIHGDDAEHTQQAEGDDEDTKLPFGDHLCSP